MGIRSGGSLCKGFGSVTPKDRVERRFVTQPLADVGDAAIFVPAESLFRQDVDVLDSPTPLKNGREHPCNRTSADGMTWIMAIRIRRF